MATMTIRMLWVAISVNLIQGYFAATDSFYTAAVFEHACFGTKEDPASLIVETNLKFYMNAIKIASSKGVDMIVYPEYGLFPYADRKRVKEFLETIPDPMEVETTPCIEEAYSQKPILHTLSCMARNNSMFVVANMGDIQNCEGDPNCPSDGVFQYNTNVVFDRNGTLLVRYHKENLFYETSLNNGRKQQNTVFETDFGIFATYVCFDIAFERMNDIIQNPFVDGIAFSTMWVNIMPQLTTIQMWQSWAMLNNATYMAACIQMAGEKALGSGIFHEDQGALVYTFNPDGISKLVVSRVPRRDSETFSTDSSITAVTETESWMYEEDGRDVPMFCSEKLLGPPTDRYLDYRCSDEETANYTFVKLTEPSGHLEACSNGMCCTLDYSANDMTENFYLGVINETYIDFDYFYFCEESCLLVRCEPFGDNPCSVFPLRSETVFQYVHLRAKFTTDIVYPSVVESQMRLTPVSEWTYNIPNNSSEDGQINFSSQPGRKITTLGLKGRCFEREPDKV